MTYPLDPALYEDLTPSLSQNIAAGLGQSLGLYGARGVQNYFQGNQLEKLGLPRSLAGLPKELQQEYIKNILKNQQSQQLLSQIYPDQVAPPNVNVTTAPQMQPTSPTIPTTAMPGQITTPEGQGTTPQTPPTAKTVATPYGEEHIFTIQDRINRTAAAIAISNPALAENYRKGEEAKLKILLDQAEQENERLKPVLKKIDESEMQTEIKANALNNLTSAINSGETGLGLNWLAEATGQQWLLTAKGAQFLTASKEFFLGSLSRAGTRPNQWIEQQLRTFLPQFGRSQEANLVVTEMLRTDANIESAFGRFVNEVMDEDRAKYGYIKPNVQARASKRWKEYAQAEQDDLQRRIGNVIFKNPNSENTIMVDKEGKSYNIPPDKVEESKKKGLKVYGAP